MDLAKGDREIEERKQVEQSSDGSRGEEQIGEERSSEEERVICEEFNTWRKNVPYLYDMLLSHGLTWPSLTVQWFPEAIRNEENETTTQRVLLSTHTSSQADEHLVIASLTLPDTVSDSSVRSLEDGGYGLGESKVRIVQKIPMPSEVNRARYMPGNSNLIAVRFDLPEVHLYDYTKHGSFPRESEPNMVLAGHTEGGFGLVWHPVRENTLVTAGYDGRVCTYQIDQSTTPVAQLQESGEINDISLSMDGGMAALALDKDGAVIVDLRDGSKKRLGTGKTLCAQFSLESEHLVATGSSGGRLGVWDIRNDSMPLHDLVGHAGDVLQVEWSPHFEDVLASSSADRRVNLWDLSRVGQEQSAVDAEDGPPELLFVHGGHTDTVCDLSWNPHEPWEIATVAEDNVLQVWQIAREVASDEEEA
ncbi:histone-binding protein RBBP4 [Nematocida homosporus]|uniref:histone-binding protein RBBP4 n=1 Tax=Nematocida homosporus TaxID=1912981 RepID=UPI00221EBF82|nr:histone-binding protein RBBP4 [Nematocida homosporus]KAI5185537.1 histone-binding protein RBBP4 [Nematocida homosporus]